MILGKFENFNAEIEPIEWVIDNVVDHYNNTCTVNIILVNDTAKFGVTLHGFTYGETWIDSEIFSFIDVKLKEYEV